MTPFAPETKFQSPPLRTFALFATLAIWIPLAAAQTTPPSEAASAPESVASAPIAPVSPAPIVTGSKLQFTPPPTAFTPPMWAGLSRTQQIALAPLERDWDKLDPARKSKWMEIVPRFMALSSDEQARMHERMRAWTRLSPAERQQARIGFQVAQQLTGEDRQAKWEAYQALSPEKRQELAEKAAQKLLIKPAGPHPAGLLEPQAKSNLVPAPRKDLPVVPVAPSVLQAKPGVTTVLINQAKTVPAHQQAGQTKVLADPALVDSKTLLPKKIASAQ
jgi:hypothetical protein